ncbi:hypothetical protein NXV73_02150 [Bacteroides salyersiae]|nr:hypothetical protein [Bacteroides salyersiae]
MNIAITGASGFIGRHLTAFFTEQGTSGRSVRETYVPGRDAWILGTGIVAL